MVKANAEIKEVGARKPFSHAKAKSATGIAEWCRARALACGPNSTGAPARAPHPRLITVVTASLAVSLVAALRLTVGLHERDYRLGNGTRANAANTAKYTTVVNKYKSGIINGTDYRRYIRKAASSCSILL